MGFALHRCTFTTPWASLWNRIKTIIATLMASLKPIKNWVVIGDWNVQIQDILSSNVAENCGGPVFSHEGAYH